MNYIEVHTKKILVQSFALLIRSVFRKLLKIVENFVWICSELYSTLATIVTEGRSEISSLSYCKFSQEKWNHNPQLAIQKAKGADSQAQWIGENDFDLKKRFWLEGAEALGLLFNLYRLLWKAMDPHKIIEFGAGFNKSTNLSFKLSQIRAFKLIFHRSFSSFLTKWNCFEGLKKAQGVIPRLKTTFLKKKTSTIKIWPTTL